MAFFAVLKYVAVIKDLIVLILIKHNEIPTTFSFSFNMNKKKLFLFEFVKRK